MPSREPTSLMKFGLSRLEVVGTVSIGCALTSCVLLGFGGYPVLAVIAAVAFTGAGVVLFSRAPSALARTGAFHRVEIRVEPVRPGEETRVQVVLEPRAAVTIRSGRLVMRVVECTWVDRDGGHVEQIEVVAQQAWPMELPKQLDRPLTHPMKVRALAEASVGAPKSVWTELAVELELERWPLITEVVVVPVLPPQAPREANPAPSTLDDEPELWVVLYRTQLRRGETIYGDVKVSPFHKAQHASAVVARLTWVAHRRGNERSHHALETTLAKGPFSGDTTVQFAITVPLDAPLTYRGTTMDLDWYVEAELIDAPGVSPRARTGFVVG